jgi:hypothetical protein
MPSNDPATATSRAHLAFLNISKLSMGEPGFRQVNQRGGVPRHRPRVKTVTRKEFPNRPFLPWPSVIYYPADKRTLRRTGGREVSQIRSVRGVRRGFVAYYNTSTPPSIARGVSPHLTVSLILSLCSVSRNYYPAKRVN